VILLFHNKNKYKGFIMEYIQMRVTNDRHYKIRCLAAERGESISTVLGEIIDFFFLRKEENNNTDTQESKAKE